MRFRCNGHTGMRWDGRQQQQLAAAAGRIRTASALASPCPFSLPRQGPGWLAYTSRRLIVVVQQQWGCGDPVGGRKWGADCQSLGFPSRRTLPRALAVAALLHGNTWFSVITGYDDDDDGLQGRRIGSRASPSCCFSKSWNRRKKKEKSCNHIAAPILMDSICISWKCRCNNLKQVPPFSS